MSALHYTAIHKNIQQHTEIYYIAHKHTTTHCSILVTYQPLTTGALQSVAVYFSVLQHILVCCSHLTKIYPHSCKNLSTYCILLISIAFCHVSENFSLYYLLYVIVNIDFYFSFYIARDVITDLLILFDIYHFYYTRACLGTHTQAHVYDERTGVMARSRHSNLVGRDGSRAC